jgi:hypothetical protein
VRKKLPAYLTLEAALVLPIALVVIVCVLTMSFVLYNRCIAAQDAVILGFRESIARDSRLSFTPNAYRAKGRGSEVMSGKYLAADSVTCSAKTSGTMLTFHIQGTSYPAVFRSDAVMPRGVFSFSVRINTRKSDPPLQVRRFRRATYLALKLREKAGANGNH